MIKKWLEFNENIKNKYTKVNAKIDLLEDLSQDLKDIGLKIDIWNGSRKNDFDKIAGKPMSSFIIMMIEDIDSILDKDGYYENSLSDKKEIKEFEENLKSFKFNYRAKSSGGDKIWYYFEKHSKMTNSPVLKSYL